MKGHSRSLKAVILAAGQAFTKLTGLLSAIFLARYLSQGDYSTYRQALLAYGTAAPFLALGLPKALYYFLPGREQRAGGVFLENFLLLSVMGVLFMGALLCGGADLLAWRFSNPDLATVLLLFAPFAFFMLPQGAFTACMMGRNRVGYVAVFQPLSKLVMVAAVIVVALLWKGSRGAVAGAVVGAAIIYLPTVLLMAHVCRGGSWKISWHGLKEQLHYSVPLGAGAIVGATAANIDKILVSSMGTREQFAVYVNGALQLPLIGIVTGSVVSVLLPDMARYYRAGKPAEAIAIWKRAAVKCGLILIPCGVFLAGIGQEFMVLLYSEQYRASGIPFTFYALLLPLSSISFGTPLIAAGKTKMVLLEASVALALNFGLTIVAIRLFGYFGAAGATLFTAYVWAGGFNTLQISRYYRTPVSDLFAKRELGLILFASIVASASFLLLLLPIASAPVRIVMCGVPFASILLLVYLRTGLVTVGQLRQFVRKVTSVRDSK